MGLKFGEYDKNILKVFSGTAIAQAIAFLTVPLIARIYGPSEYGIYAAFVASVSILSILSTAKFELAIMVPDTEAEVNTLINLSNFINLLVCVLVGLFTLIAPLSLLNHIFNIHQNSRTLFLMIPVVTYLMAAFQIFNYWLVRHKKFAVLSLNKILRSLLFGVFSLALGLKWTNALFLCIALGFSHLFANLFLRTRLKELRLNVFAGFKRHNLKEFKLVAKIHKRFPAYVLPAELMSVVCAQMPVFIFLWYFSSTESGFFSFVLTLLNIPITLLSSAILDVFKERAAKDYRETGSCREAYINTLKKMLILSVPPFVMMFFFGDIIIKVFFGAKWIPSIKFFNILLFMFFLKFISSPLSFIFYIVNRQKEDFAWHIYILLSTTLVLFLGSGVFKNSILTVILYAINFSIIYIIYLIRSFQLSRQQAVI